MSTPTIIEGKPPTAANRLGLDYRAEAARMGPPPTPIVDGHLHINGTRAVEILKDAADLYGVTEFVTQTQLSNADAVRATFGHRARFVAIPEYMSKDRRHAFTDGFLENLDAWHERYGARMVKLWNAPRLREFLIAEGLDPAMASFDSPWRMQVAERAVELGMMLMVHVADPDTWFATKYVDSSVYGTKRFQYESLSRLLDRFDVPCLCAHMCGWPEDLGFLSEFLQRHPKVILDTSATKWMIRELSKHETDRFTEFLDRFGDRILFGSDIVTHDDHLNASDGASKVFGIHLAASEDEAFELYASRYWAMRTMFETGYDGESPIADPDLMMVDPTRYDAMSAPRIRGHGLSVDRLVRLYRGTAERRLLSWLDGDA